MTSRSADNPLWNSDLEPTSVVWHFVWNLSDCWL